MILLEKCMYKSTFDRLNDSLSSLKFKVPSLFIHFEQYTKPTFL